MSAKSYLGKREGVNLVLGGELKTNGSLSVVVVDGLDASFGGSIDLLVVQGGEHGEVLRGGHGGAVFRSSIAGGSRVAGDGSLLDIVANLTADEETLVAEDGIGNGVDGTTGQEVAEDTEVCHRVLVCQVELLASEAGLSRVCESERLKLKAIGDVVVKLELGGQERACSPRLGEGDACTSAFDQPVSSKNMNEPMAA